jgi:hypothetical protein
MARSGDLQFHSGSEGLGVTVTEEPAAPMSEESTHREGLDDPISSEATKAPGQRAHAARPPPPRRSRSPTVAAMPGSVTKALPPITPASPASARRRRTPS